MAGSRVHDEDLDIWIRAAEIVGNICNYMGSGSICRKLYSGIQSPCKVIGYY